MKEPMELRASSRGSSRSSYSRSTYSPSSVSYRPVVRYTTTYVSRPATYVYTPGVVYVYHPVVYGDGYFN